MIDESDIPEHTKEETELATYEFIGWFLQNEDGSLADEAFDFETPITQNIVLVAQFEETLKESEDGQKSEDNTIEDETEDNKDKTEENSESSTEESEEDGETDNTESVGETSTEGETDDSETEGETEESIEEDSEVNSESDEETTEENSDETSIEESVTHEIQEDAVPIEEDENKGTVSGNDMVMYKEEETEEVEYEAEES